MYKMGDNAATKITNEKGNSTKSRTLIEEAYLQIKKMIFYQKIVPGQRLLNRDLCKMLNMSRTPIINALHRLVQEGFVDYENFSGFSVKPIDLQEVWDAFGVRQAIEVYAVEQAIKIASAIEMAILEEKLREHEEHKPHYYTRKKFLLDSEFHLQIARMARNRVLKWVLRGNYEHIYLRAKLDSYDPQRMESSAQEHRKLVETMNKKDIQGSIEIMKRHIQRGRDLVIECLSTDEI